MGFRELKVWQCEECGAVYESSLRAESCCKVYQCDTCGKFLEKYRTRCDACIEKLKYEKAKKISYEEYKEQYPEEMLVTKKGEFIEEPNGEDDYYYATITEKVGIDADEVIESIQDRLYEDGEISEEGIEKLEEFAKEWNKKYALPVYHEDRYIVVEVKKK